MTQRDDQGGAHPTAACPADCVQRMHVEELQQPQRIDRRIGAGAALGLVGLCALWGLGQVAIKVANAGISPLLNAGLRSAGAAVLLLGWCAVRNIRLIERDATALAGSVAGILFAVEFLLLYLGLEYTTAARSVVFLNTSPFFVALGAHWAISRDRLSVAKAIGLVFAFLGVVLAFGDGLLTTSPRGLLGDAMVLTGAAAWGATTVIIKASALSRIRPERTLMYQLLISALALIVASALAGEAGVQRLTPLIVLAVLYQIVIVAFASYLLWFWFVANYAASQVSSFTFLTPVFGVIAGALLLDEPVSPGLVGALVLIAMGIYVINRPSRESG